MRGIEAFEQEQYKEAAEVLYPLRRGGAIVPIKYLEHMKKHNLAEINDDYANDFEPIPLDGHTLSNSFFQASLGYIELKKSKKKGIQHLEPLILSGNARAISLIEKEFEVDQKIVNLFKDKKLKKIKIKTAFSSYLKFTHLGPIELSDGVDISRLFSLNANDFSPEFNKAVKTFKVNSQKRPDLMGNIAFQVAKLNQDLAFWHFLALENGETASCVKLANICLGAAAGKYQAPGYEQLHVTQAEEEAFSLFRYYASKLQNNSSADPQELGKLWMRYGTLLGEGVGGKKDPIKERWCYKMAANKGIVDAQHNYAFMLEKGEGGDKDLIEARHSYKMAADLGYANSQLNYAFMLLEGQGGDKDLCEARPYFKMAAGGGLTMAHYHLAVMIENGEGEDVDFEEALQNYKKAADQGCAAAQYAYGRRLEERGQENDLFEARRYYKMAADQGVVEAQTNYARMAHDGEGGDRDLAEAFLYSEKAAQQGFAIAQANCGMLLWHGTGCTKNPEKALAYFRKSAVQGLSQAIIALPALEQEWLSCKNPELKVSIDTSAYNTSDEFVELSLPVLTEATDCSDEAESSDESSYLDINEILSDNVKDFSSNAPENTALRKAVLFSEEATPEKMVPKSDKGKEEFVPEGLISSDELRQYDQKLHQQYAADRQEKQAQKARKKAQRGEIFAWQTLSIPQETYRKGIQLLHIKQEKLCELSLETRNFLKAIFGKGIKINIFSLTDAKKAFAELGCAVETVSGENSTLVTFILDDGTVVKLKFHNPHGHGDNNLYKALQRYFKRFCISIGKTPENY